MKTLEQKANLWETQIEPIQLLASDRNKIVIKYGDSLSRKEDIDTIRRALYTVRPVLFPNANQLFYQHYTSGKGHRASHDPVAMFFDALDRVFANHPEVLLPIITRPEIRHHFVDIEPLELKAAAAAAE